MSDRPEHKLVTDGTGFFSKSHCTGCDFAYKGSPDDAKAEWSRYHADGKVLPMPTRVELPPMAEDPKLQQIEREIIRRLAYWADMGNESRVQQYVALGMAECRAILLDEPRAHAGAYVADLTARITSVSKRQREKLRHPAVARERQQQILEES